MDDLITIKEAAARLHITDRTVRKYIRRGEFTCYRLQPNGGRILVRWSQIERWLETRRVEARSDPDFVATIVGLFGKKRTA